MSAARKALALLAASMLVAACGTAPPAPSPDGAASARPADLASIVERRRQNAIRMQLSGDLAGAAAEWQVLTLLDPRNESFRRELAGARAAIARLVAEQLQAGNAALRRGDVDAASDAMLRVLAVAPDNTDAAHALREMERRRAVRVQAERVARLRPEDYGIPGGRAAPRTVPPVTSDTASAEASRAYDFAQSMELFRAGDVRNGLAGFRRYVDVNPGDRAGRQEIGSAVFERAKTLEAQGQAEPAATLYEQAIALSGGAPNAWDVRLKALRRKLAAEHYEQGMRLYRTDLDGAIRHLQTSVTYDPSSSAAQARLQEAKLLQDKLKRIGGDVR